MVFPGSEKVNVVKGAGLHLKSINLVVSRPCGAGKRWAGLAVRLSECYERVRMVALAGRLHNITIRWPA